MEIILRVNGIYSSPQEKKCSMHKTNRTTNRNVRVHYEEFGVQQLLQHLRFHCMDHFLIFTEWFLLTQENNFMAFDRDRLVKMKRKKSIAFLRSSRSFENPSTHIDFCCYCVRFSLSVREKKTFIFSKVIPSHYNLYIFFVHLRSLPHIRFTFIKHCTRYGDQQDKLDRMNYD